MDGLLVVDKPCGPTSHDVVERTRRLLRERRVGHTGTLDPMASGVLALVLGRATRLAQFMSGDDKAYEASIRLGVSTTSYDADGTTVGEPYMGPLPDAGLVEATLASFVGTFEQQPPAFSAKKIAGKRSYALARAHTRGGVTDGGDTPLLRPAPVSVTLTAAAVVGYEDATVDVTLTCSAGFYVRSLAHDLGERLGTGAHLSRLRRTRSGAADIGDATTLAALEADPARALTAVVPMARTLPRLPSLELTAAGVMRAGHGAVLTPHDFSDPAAVMQLAVPSPPAAVKLLSPMGDLVAVGRPHPGDRGFLHPSVVLM